MFGQHAAYIIPSYVITALVMLAIIVWIQMNYARQKGEIAALEAKGIRRASDKGGKK